MPEDGNVSPTHGYVLGQLLRAWKTTQEHFDANVRQLAAKKIERLEQVLRGMLSGKLSIGAQTPVEGIPAWVTLEVVHGGFATGNLLAGGALQQHELAMLSRLGLPAKVRSRSALNRYYLGEAGRSELVAMLHSGCYRINVPEEAALLASAWLESRGMTEKSRELIDCISPFFDRLRFYPVPDQRVISSDSTVHRCAVGETINALANRLPKAQVARMMEALRVWQPLYDRTVAHFLETVEDDEPCRRFADDWPKRAAALLEEYARLRKSHGLCLKPDRPKENFARLRGYMKICVENPAQLTTRDRGMIRHILRCYVARHGTPDTEEFAQRRREQALLAGAPTHDELIVVLMSRLERLPEDSGVADLDAALVSVREEESARFKVPVGASIPESLAAKVRRATEAPIEQLIAKAIIPSADVMAELLPQISSQVRSAAIEDLELRQLYGVSYKAFRRRRSLLLLNLERQVRLEELPWIRAIEVFRLDDDVTRTQAKRTLEKVCTLAITSFPQAVLPNKLLQELRSLATASGLSIPIVDELAADIFMGTFSEKFVRAAQIAGRLLGGTLYERYYGLDYERVLRFGDDWRDFGALCAELARVSENESWSVSRNGRVIEQSQILTTHNLAGLFVALDLQGKLAGELNALAESCFRWICRQRPPTSWKARLRATKNSAYAWRQMVFFLSLLDEKSAGNFIIWARGHLAEQKEANGKELQPALAGLEWIANGGTFSEHGAGGEHGEALRVIGWSAPRA